MTNEFSGNQECVIFIHLASSKDSQRTLENGKRKMKKLAKTPMQEQFVLAAPSGLSKWFHTGWLQSIQISDGTSIAIVSIRSVRRTHSQHYIPSHCFAEPLIDFSRNSCTFPGKENSNKSERKMRRRQCSGGAAVGPKYSPASGGASFAAARRLGASAE